MHDCEATVRWLIMDRKDVIEISPNSECYLGFLCIDKWIDQPLDWNQLQSVWIVITRHIAALLCNRPLGSRANHLRGDIVTVHTSLPGVWLLDPLS